MKKSRLFLSFAIALPCLLSCGEVAKMFVTFHQELSDDVKVEFASSTLQADIEAQEPEIVSKRGYTSAWEDYSIEGKTSSFTVNAVYTPITYYVTFIAQGVTVEQVPFTIEDIKDDHSKLPEERTPAVPGHEWVDPYWEDYSLSLSNIDVYAKYDHLKEFTVSFAVEGTPVGSSITLTRDDLDAEGNIDPDKIPQEVLDYTVEGKDVVWDFVILSAEDTTINATVRFHPYYIKFVDFSGEQIGDLVPYTKENATWESVAKPAAPELDGYDTYWNDATLTYSDSEIVVATPGKTGKYYFITFEGYDEPQKVQFGEPYVLDHKTTAVTKWVDGNDNEIANEGIWNVADNVTLHSEKVDKEDFSGAVVPSFIDVEHSQNIRSVEIAQGEGINGSNALKFVVDAEGDFGLKIDQEYLDDVFADPSVETLTFVAKSSQHNNNFRHRTAATNVCYERNNSKFGLETFYKKFSFTRAMYESHADATDFVIYGGQGNFDSVAGAEIYIDSFLFNEGDVMKAAPDRLSFENGYVALSSDGNLEAGSCYDNGTAIVEDKFKSLKNSAVTIENLTHSTERATDGISSLSFTKNNGYLSLYLGSAFATKVLASASKTFAFDVYSTTYVGSTEGVKNFLDGKNGTFEDQGGCLNPNKWTTFTLDSTRFGPASDSRFLIIQGSSAGTFYFDNFRIVEA